VPRQICRKRGWLLLRCVVQRDPGGGRSLGGARLRRSALSAGLVQKCPRGQGGCASVGARDQQVRLVAGDQIIGVAASQ
jgi:hypothetical protein